MANEYAQTSTRPLKIGKIKEKVALIIPCYNELDQLFKHLNKLKKQTFLDFDCIIVLSNILNAKEIGKKIANAKYPYGIIILKRKYDSGSAGAFYVGEKYILEKKYDCFILADVDAIPEKNNLLKEMIELRKKGAGFVLPQCNLEFEGAYVMKTIGLHFYGLVGKEILKKVGLHFAPLYIGADDAEYFFRILTVSDLVHAQGTVVHPARHTIFKELSRSTTYYVNGLLILVPKLFISNYIVILGIRILAYLLFGSVSMRKLGMQILVSTLLNKYGKEAYLPIKTKNICIKNNAVEVKGKKFQIEEYFEEIITPNFNNKGKNIFNIEFSRRPNPLRLIHLCLSVIGKKILVKPVNTYVVVLCIMFARETWISTDNGAYLGSKNHNILIRLLKNIIFTFLLPFSLFLVFLFFLFNWIRKKETFGFGLKTNYAGPN